MKYHGFPRFPNVSWEIWVSVSSAPLNYVQAYAEASSVHAWSVVYLSALPPGGGEKGPREIPREGSLQYAANTNCTSLLLATAGFRKI